jgi:hypothetical protein
VKVQRASVPLKALAEATRGAIRGGGTRRPPLRLRCESEENVGERRSQQNLFSSQQYRISPRNLQSRQYQKSESSSLSPVPIPTQFCISEQTLVW